MGQISRWSDTISGRKSNGTAPSHFCRGSSSVARKVLQSLEGIKIVEKDQTGYVKCVTCVEQYSNVIFNIDKINKWSRFACLLSQKHAIVGHFTKFLVFIKISNFQRTFQKVFQLIFFLIDRYHYKLYVHYMYLNSL